LWNVAKTILEDLKPIISAIHLKKQKQEQMKPKVSTEREIVSVRVGTSEIENKNRENQ